MNGNRELMDEWFKKAEQQGQIESAEGGCEGKEHEEHKAEE